MDPTSTAAHKPTLNGTLKKHHPHQIRHPQSHPSSLYRECLKNHAAGLGGHALDGCGEFMPSPSSNPSDPSSLTCVACGCHRNFHRRLHQQPPLSYHEGGEEDDDENEDEGADVSQNDEVVNRQRSSSPPPASAPHMLLALSTGPTTVLPRKRLRSKFSPEQKERMQELSERLGWRMQKRDEGLIEERCREIGVGKGVFKVWMHNNKHNFKRPPPADINDNNTPTGPSLANTNANANSNANVVVNGSAS